MAENIIELKNTRDLIQTLTRFDMRTRAGIMRKVIRAGSAPIRKASKSIAPERTGKLKESMGIKVKVYKQSGNTAGIIGARVKFLSRAKKFKGKYVDAFYGHMVEGGTRPHTIKGPVKLGNKVFMNLQHPGMAPRRFMQKAANRSSGEAVRRFTAKMNIELKKEAAKKKAVPSG